VTALRIEGLVAGYAGVPVIRDVALTVDEGQMVALLGANGAGKTTTLLSIAGVVKPLGGIVEVLGKSVVGKTPHQIANQGLALLPDNRGLFRQLNVADNIRLRSRTRRPPDEVFEWFPNLATLRRRRAGLLSGGEQQMLALACCLVSHPKVLMIDEMSLGLAPIIVKQLLPQIRQIAKEEGTAVLIVEQQTAATLEVVDEGYVMKHGVIAVHGTAEELRSKPELVQAAYLGDSLVEEEAVGS
jgi:branched-chain amino acid transport system ATP-binding protein